MAVVVFHESQPFWIRNLLRREVQGVEMPDQGRPCNRWLPRAVREGALERSGRWACRSRSSGGEDCLLYRCCFGAWIRFDVATRQKRGATARADSRVARASGKLSNDALGGSGACVESAQVAGDVKEATNIGNGWEGARKGVHRWSRRWREPGGRFPPASRRPSSVATLAMGLAMARGSVPRPRRTSGNRGPSGPAEV